MDKNQHLVHYKIFEPFKNLFAFTTTLKTLDINQVRFTDEPIHKKKLAEVLNLRYENLIFPKQTHSNCVVEIQDLSEIALEETDALVTNVQGLCICIQTADCVPILLFDPVEKAISAIHAGWRGTVGKIVEVAIRKMRLKYGTLPENVVAAIGPSIGPEIYEVGDEVVIVARKSIPNVELALHKNNAGKFHFNLWEANRQLLLSCGLKSTNIEILGECSFIEKEKFYSARRDGMETGRMVSGIMLDV
jgi:YfiH family protein